MKFGACCIAVIAVVAWLVWTRTTVSRRGIEQLAPGVDDDRWLHEGKDRYERLIHQHYGSPESIAAGGMNRLRSGDLAAALFFLQKAIDLLHTHYNFNEMRQRQPSDRDLPIIDAYLDTLDAVIMQRPTAPVSVSMREVTHRLRTISTACHDGGLDPGRYLTALLHLGELAPDTDVSDIFWRNPSAGEVLRRDDEPGHG